MTGSCPSPLTDPFAVFVGGFLFGIPTNVWVMLVIVALFSPLFYTPRVSAAIISCQSAPILRRRSSTASQHVWCDCSAFVLMGALGGLAQACSLLGYFGSSRAPILGLGYELLLAITAALSLVVLPCAAARRLGTPGAALGSILLGVVASRPGVF